MSETDDNISSQEIVSQTRDLTPAPKPRRWQLPLFVVIPIQALLMVGILGGSYMVADRMIKNKPETKKRRAFKTVHTIETTLAKKADHQPLFVTYGQTLAARNVDLRALVSGEVVAINQRLGAGAKVAKGEALVEIDSFVYEGALAEAKSNLDEAKARILEMEAQISLENSKLESAREQLSFAQADFKRAEKLRKSGSMTQQALETRKLTLSQRKQAVALSKDTIKVQQAKLEQLNASLVRLNWRVTQAEKNLNSTTLTAPFAGIIRTRNADIGRNVTANDVVVSLYEADTLEARFTLTDAQYGRLQTSDTGLVGRPVKLIWTVGGKDHIWSAKIDRLGAEISSSRGGVEVYAKVENSTQSVTLRPGAFVAVEVPDIVIKDAFKIPDLALYDSNKVYVRVEDKLKQVSVNIAAFDGEWAIVSGGLKDGDKVLTTRITEVSDGLAVREESDSPKVKPGAKKPQQGRPSPEEIAQILKANKLSLEEFRALDREAKSKLIRAWRTKES